MCTRLNYKSPSNHSRWSPWYLRKFDILIRYIDNFRRLRVPLRKFASGLSAVLPHFFHERAGPCLYACGSEPDDLRIDPLWPAVLPWGLAPVRAKAASPSDEALELGEVLSAGLHAETPRGLPICRRADAPARDSWPRHSIPTNGDAARVKDQTGVSETETEHTLEGA